MKNVTRIFETLQTHRFRFVFEEFWPKRQITAQSFEIRG